MQPSRNLPGSTRRPRSLRAKVLASVAVVALLAGGPVLAQTTAAPPPANANLAPPPPNTGYAELARAVKPAVVNVRVEREAEAGPGGPGGQQMPPMDPEMRRFFERFFGEPGQGPGPQQQPPQRMRGEGSGFIISPDGLIVTNAHVAAGADDVTVLLDDGSEHKAQLKGVDDKTDLALLKVDAGKALPYVTFGDSSKMQVGDVVVAVGNPFGLGGTVTQGIISATGREIGSGPYDDFLQVDAAINRGNSGGPTFNLKGEVVGVNTAIFSPSGGSVGIGFAIASNLVKEVIADLQDDGKVERGWLGVQIQELDEDIAQSLGLDRARGALVSGVQPGSPAEAAGIVRGDVILSFAGDPIDRVGQLSRAVAEVEAGTQAEMQVWRNGAEQKVTADIAPMPAADEVAAAAPQSQNADQPRLGLALAPILPEQRQQLGLPADARGVLVAEVQPGGPAAEKGMEAGDVIMSVDNKPVDKPADVVAAVREAHEGGRRSVLLYVSREGNERFEAIPLATS